MGAAYALGFVAGCLVVPGLLARVGHIRTFAALAAFAAVAVLTASLWIAAGPWVALRAIAGFCAAGTGLVIESWLNERAAQEHRATVMGAYMIVNLAAGVVGQSAVGAIGAITTAPFVVAAMLLTLSLVPTALSTGPVPVPPPAIRLRPAELFRLSPLAALGCLAIGLVNGAFGTLGPVYFQETGFGTGETAALMSAVLLGGALLQLPIGRLSDRADRRYVLTALAVGAAAAAWAFDALNAGALDAALPLAFVMGGFIHTMYAVTVAHANDHAAPGTFVETSGGLLLLFGLGAIAGPILGGAAMGFFGPGALMLFMGVVHTGLAALALLRMLARKAPAREAFEPLAGDAMSAAAAAALDPRAEGADGDAPVPAAAVPAH